MITLVDCCLLRQSELPRCVAGSAAIDPLTVLPMVAKLDPQDLLDEHAKKFISALQERTQEIQAADDERRVEIVVGTAFNLHSQVDYCKWLLHATEEGIPAGEYAQQCIRKLMQLVVVREGIGDLQDFAAKLIVDHGWGTIEERACVANG